MNRSLRILRNIALSLVGLIVLVAILVNLTPVQNFIARRVLVSLAEKLETKVSVKHIRVDLLNHVLIEGLYIEDKAHDTLLYAGEARLRITDWFFLRKDKPVITYVGLHNAYVHMYRTAKSDEWNYQFVIDAFDTGKKDSTKKQNELELDLKKADLQNVRFHMDDAWVGSDMDIDVGSFQVDAREIDLKKRVINVNSIDGKAVGIVLRDYEGGRPPRPKKKRALDTTAFNKGGWVVKIDGISLENSFFSLDAGTDPAAENEFDPEHIGITNINIDARRIVIKGDTLHGRMEHLAAKERSGIMIKKGQADVTVSPNASIADNLYLETNNSKLRRYYAMHYERFPDFNHYIDKVTMVVDLRDASVDSRDVAYFAPVLRKWPTMLRASGQARGTVADLEGRNLQLSDGNSVFKGDLKMRGLPDIYTTWIEYTNGEIFTNGKGIFKYAPDLRNNKNIALDEVSHAYFKGNFIGYIENFAADGVLTSNLGTVRSNVKMRIPDFRQRTAVYSGTVATEGFNLGTLLRQKDLGVLSFHGNVSGNAFDPKDASIKIDAVIDRIDYRQYPYKNIIAKGLLEKNRFTGDVLVDDPNLALAFNGVFDMSGNELAINAKANLLKGDLNALNLVKDTVTASADFDLDWRGNSIDNFLGYGKLYNINLVRNGHRLDLDSIYINSTAGTNEKLLTIESNAFDATVRGNYQLSTMPASVQAYIASYLPAYIKAPTQKISDQNFSFEIKTKEVDSLLGVISSDLKGFTDATITGSLNTMQQQLSLDAKIPFGQVGNVKINNASINSDGNFRLLGVNAEADNVVFGDLHGSMSITTTVGNDSLLFNIATTSTGEYGTATINGRARASSDTLYLDLLPSEFYMAKSRWEIAGGSHTILSGKYLSIQNLKLHSGQQEIAVNTQNELSGPVLLINASNFNLAQLGNLIGIAEYEPNGRLDGNIKVSDPLGKVMVVADVKALNARLGTDTLGTITAAGSYDAKKHLLVLDPSSGVYRGDASITAGGRTVFDSTSRQRIEGEVKLNNAPLSWIAPFVEGYVSDIAGTLTGNVKVGGTAIEPDVDGNVSMNNAHVRIDYLGTAYDIHNANIKVNNSEINFGDFTLFDVHKNNAIFNGRITHNRFKDLKLAMNMGSSKFEVLNLKENENEAFYGNLIAGFADLNIRGPLNDITMRITKARPTGKSQLFIPIGATSPQATYNYVTFKSYDTTTKVVTKKKSTNKFTIEIEAILNPLAEITLVLDPTTGDAINATGNGNISMKIPSDNDIAMNGTYNIEQGSYLFTLKQLFFKRKFDLNAGSKIVFNGAIARTQLDVEGIYTVRTRLFEVLNKQQKDAINALGSDNRETKETKIARNVNVGLIMTGSLESPKLSFKLDVPDKSVSNTLAALEIQRINSNEGDLFNQVASLLLIGSFYPQDAGAIGGGATAGAISNVSEVLSGTASAQLTNMLNRLVGSDDFSLNVKYQSYSVNDISIADNTQNRSTVGVNLQTNLFSNLLKDRLTLEYGGSYDWGKSTSTGNKSVFNPVGDFRLQYQFKEGGNLRGSVFRTSTYDASLGDRNLSRMGLGISWRKSFNNLTEFFRGQKYAAQQLELEQQRLQQQDSIRRRPSGTW